MVMKETRMQKDFIGERGFVKLISSLREVMDKRGWSFFCKHKQLGLLQWFENLCKHGTKEGKNLLC